MIRKILKRCGCGTLSWSLAKVAECKYLNERKEKSIQEKNIEKAARRSQDQGWIIFKKNAREL